MSRRQAAIAVVIAALLVLAGGLWWLSSRPEVAPQAADDPAANAAAATESVEVFFPGPGRRLYPESRDVPAADTAEGRSRAVIEALLEGPQGEERFAPLPDGVQLAGTHFGTGGILYLDFRSEGTPLSQGSGSEQLTAYSVVNSVMANLPQVRGVVFLWNGVQRSTLAGHLDTTRPLVASPELVARGGDAGGRP